MVVSSNAEDDVFTQLDKFGKYQTYQYFLVCLPLMIVAMINVNYVFVAGEVRFRCRVTECETDNSSIVRPSWWPENVDEKCVKPMIDEEKLMNNKETCSNDTFLDEAEDCEDWIYEDNNTIVSELNLGCESWKAALVGSIHNGGMITSMSIMGWLSDKFGRKPTVILCSIGGIVGVVKIFLKNFYAYIAVELLESILSSGLLTVAIVLMIEVGGQSNRVLAGVIFSYATYVGEVIFAFIAIGIPYWKHLIIVIYCPTVIFVVYGLLLKESTRWDMLRGKTSHARKTLQQIARMNKLKVTESELEATSDVDLNRLFNIETQKVEETVKDAMRSAEMMTRLAVTSFCFFTAGFIYYGLMVQSVLLPGSKYVNFALASLSSFPGDLLAFFAFSRFGRRISLQCGFLACGLFCVAQAFAPESLPWLKVILFLFGKMSVALCFTGMFTYSLELFPTSVRGSLVGVGNTASRVGSMLSPLTPLLSTEISALPSFLFAATAVLAGILLIFTPETKCLPMFDTIAQIEEHRKANKDLS